MIRIRAATAADVETIAFYYAGLHAEEWEPSGRRPPSGPEPDWGAEVRAALEDPGTLLFVAEADDQPAGTVRIEFAERPYFRIADIRRLYVAPAWRRRGVATELMRVAEEAAREGGAAEARLTVVAGNEPALRFYDGLGYGDFATRLAKRLR